VRLLQTVVVGTPKSLHFPAASLTSTSSRTSPLLVTYVPCITRRGRVLYCLSFLHSFILFFLVDGRLEPVLDCITIFCFTVLHRKSYREGGPQRAVRNQSRSPESFSIKCFLYWESTTTTTTDVQSFVFRVIPEEHGRLDAQCIYHTFPMGRGALAPFKSYLHKYSRVLELYQQRTLIIATTQHLCQPTRLEYQAS